MHKYRLFAPGPTPVPTSVQLAMAAPILHHRTAAFERIFAQCRKDLQWLFQTKQEVLTLAGTGTAGMDSAVSNFLSRGDSAIFVNGGKFGERWGEIMRAYGCEPIEVTVPWGQAVDPDAIKKALRDHPKARAVYVQACETSTGVAHPVAEIAKLCRDRDDTLCVVDAITALGVYDLALDRDGIDVLITGSQKALMLPPGLAFIGVSEKAWKHAKRSDLPKFYLNLTTERKASVKDQSAWTSAVTLMIGMQEAMRLLKEEGLPTVFARHARMAKACRAGIQESGGSIYASAPADGVTAFVPPSGIKADDAIKRFADHYNLTIVGGQDEAKGKIIRVAHMGHFDDLDVMTFLAALKAVYSDLRAA
jgi:aspartate aminotransferase-like enzyme